MPGERLSPARHIGRYGRVPRLDEHRAAIGSALAEQAHALLPERAPLLNTLALALKAENQLPKALLTQQRAVALDPKDPLLRLRLAQLFIKQGNKPGAREALESLVRLGSTFAGQAEVAGL